MRQYLTPRSFIIKEKNVLGDSAHRAAAPAMAGVCAQWYPTLENNLAISYEAIQAPAL